jgi:HAD superfamily hydrolase (TIGR01509 family)
MKEFILFDNDGVLVETEVWYYRANVKILKELDIVLHEDIYLNLMANGKTSWEIARQNGISEEVIVKSRFKRDEYYQHYLKTENIEINGVEDVLRQLIEKYKMAIITTSRRVDFNIIHNSRSIKKYMDFVLCVEDYPRAKPYPDPYLKGLEMFNAKKENTIIVEDSERGLKSAVAAGIDCVIVKNDFVKSHNFSKAKYKVEDLKELLTIL